MNETGRRAHGLMKNRERRTRRQRNAKLNAPHPKSPAKTDKADGIAFQLQSSATLRVTIALIRASVSRCLATTDSPSVRVMRFASSEERPPNVGEHGKSQIPYWPKCELSTGLTARMLYGAHIR